MTAQACLFANLKCIKSPESPIPYRKTVLINNKGKDQLIFHRKITQFTTTDIHQIPYDNLEEIWSLIEPNLERIASEALTKSIEYHSEFKSLLDYVFLGVF